MTPLALMIYAGCTLVVAVVITAVNMANMVEKDKGSIRGFVILHMLSALTAVASAWALAGGFIWWLVDKYSG